MIRNILFAFAFLLLLASITHARDITLEWDPNTEPDISGYKIYYKASSPELPLDGTGAAEGSSPVDVGSNTKATLKGLDGSKIYYFAVTAYNSAGYESSFSNIVASDWVPVPTLPENGATASANVQFAWTSAPSDINVTYTLYYGTDPSLSAATIAPPASPPGPSLPSPPPFLAPALAAALILALILSRRRRLARSTAGSVLCVLLLASCGGGGGGGGGGGTPGVTAGGGLTGGDSGGNDSAGDPGTGPFTKTVQTGTATTQAVSALKPGTTYYWKVVANDGQKLRESTISTFTVQ